VHPLRELKMKTAVHAALISGLLLGGIAQAADGLAVPETAWPRWQARINVQPLSAGAPEGAPRAYSAALLGDYYFPLSRWLPLTPEGGLRATSGLITTSGLRAPRETLSLAETPDTQPYLGLGYTHAALRGGWGFSADVGVVAQSPQAAVRFGRALLGNGQSLDDAVRNLRLTPLVQLGVRYTF
jgi:hypothetical protein